MKELVSVIIPVYNSEKYLKRCLDSVLGQTYVEIEIVIIDDGSTDQSRVICDDYARQNQRIKVIHIPNGGVSNARNTGVRISKGSYICFIDSDDYIPSDYVKTLYMDLKSTQSDLSICGMDIEKESQVNNQDVGNREILLDSRYSKEFLDLNKTFLLYGPCNKIYKSCVIKDKGIFFDTSTSYGEDLIFNFLYLNHVKKISYTSATKYYYIKDNAASLSAVFRKDAIENEKRINKVIYDFLDERNMLLPEAEIFLRERMLDVSYNQALFWASGRGKNGYREISKMLGDETVQQALKCKKAEDYSSKIIWLMKRKYVFLFMLYVKFYNWKEKV